MTEQLDLVFAEMDREERDFERPVFGVNRSLSDEDLLAYCMGEISDEDFQSHYLSFMLPDTMRPDSPVAAGSQGMFS